MYKLTAGHNIHRLRDNAFIPPNESLNAYQEYLAWLAEGNEPEPADEVEDYIQFPPVS